MENLYTITNFDTIIFLDVLSTSLREKVIAVQHIGTSLKVHTSEVLDSTLQTELDDAVSNHDPSLPLTSSVQKIKDLDRFSKRAEVKNQILAEMAAENMERVRAGTWTVTELISLTSDAELKSILDDINTLSFEIAHSKIDALTNSLVTTEIKTNWKDKLSSHFYL